ncbi:signal peptide-containing protein [Cryptosporidium canis]|uniref:GDP-fucose protein O-fucosyltransferase 2 n=1 Tax=Cryptosporidium canis TaxID=195482 RepID=A0A9D5DDR5_9CRYT|nr:signal peptide-containing protein [Cryptosporidium canis]
MAMAITKLNEDTKPWDLNRPTVLILPPFCNVAHWTYKSKRRLSWSTFYNIRQNTLPILEYDIYKRFISTGNIKVNVIGLNFDWSNKSIESNTSTEYYNKSEVSIFNHSSSKCAFDRYVRNANVIFGGNCELLKIDSLICISFFKLMRPNEVADELLELFKSNKECSKLQTYLIKHADGILVPWPWELKKYGILNILNYNDYIRRLANMYMYENSFFDQKKPYISVHLRRNDFVFVRNNDIPTFSHVLKRLLQLSNDLGISRVVVSTDGRKSEKDELKDIFLKHNLHLHIIDVKGNVDDGIISAVSQVILLHGEYFIGTKESRFSSSIAWDCILSNQDRGND